MITAAEKLRQVILQLVGNYTIEFDMDRYTVIGVLEDIKADVTWANLEPEEEDAEEEE